jgi:hypothetical protein
MPITGLERGEIQVPQKGVKKIDKFQQVFETEKHTHKKGVIKAGKDFIPNSAT